jgi:regulator of nucleoside diphosphate kinase
MTTTTLHDFTLSPDIVLSTEDHRRLSQLAFTGIGEASTVADDLLYELDRASVVPPEQLPPDVVRMGSRVRFRTEEGDEREVTLVFPSEADIEQGRVSVMTPIGAALVGVRKGQSITWLARDGRKHVLTALTVTQANGAEPEPPAAA